jgi:hypothetical protein
MTSVIYLIFDALVLAVKLTPVDAAEVPGYGDCRAFEFELLIVYLISKFICKFLLV